MPFTPEFEAEVVRLRDLLAELERINAAKPASETPMVAVAAAAAGGAETPVSIPKHAKRVFADLTPNQQRFVAAIIGIVKSHDGINMAELTNTKCGIPFPKDDFPNMKLIQVIMAYTHLIREGDNIFLPAVKTDTKPSKPTTKPQKVVKTKTLKTVEDFNNDFAKAIEAVRADEHGDWADNVPADAPLEVSIEDVLKKLCDWAQCEIDSMDPLAHYEIDSMDPCASLEVGRFLINTKTGMVSIIPKDE